MQTNFKLYKNHAVQINDDIFDLHNDFAFLGFDYNVASRQLILKWKKLDEQWVRHEMPKTLDIILEHLEFLKIFPRDSEIQFAEDDCLRDWTYYSSELRDSVEDNECVSPSEMPGPENDVIFKFESGLIIRAKGVGIFARVSC